MTDVSFKQLSREMTGRNGLASSVLLLSIVTFISVALVWATITELDNVIRGPGKTVSAANNQLVQSSQPGVIKKRYVNEGDFVGVGEPLFEIDPIDAKTQLDQVLERQTSLELRKARLEAEIDNRTPTFSPLMMQSYSQLVTTELALYKARLEDLNTKLAILDNRHFQKLQEIEQLKIEHLTAKRGLSLIANEIQTIEPLVKSGLAPETRLIALQREAEELKGKRETTLAAQGRVSSSLDEIKEQQKAEKQTYVTTALTELSNINNELSEFAARIPALRDRVEKTFISSPVDGVINVINFTTAGAYVRSGEVLLEIVPTGSDLVVETKINPKDIADIVIGQNVKISLTAYDPTRYGRLDGIVKSISADALSGDDGKEQFYLVTVSIDSSLYEDNGDEVKILPGMVASIDVLSGKRSILEYFWQPIVKTKDRALRD